MHKTEIALPTVYQQKQKESVYTVKGYIQSKSGLFDSTIVHLGIYWTLETTAYLGFKNFTGVEQQHKDIEMHPLKLESLFTTFH